MTMKTKNTTSKATNHTVQDVCDAIRSHHNFVVVSHARPDGDAIGSQVAMGLALKALDKQVRLISAGPVPDIYSELSGVDEIEVASAATGRWDVAIVMECPELSRTELTGLNDGFVLSIDHHPGNTFFGNVNYFDESAAACGELVFSVLQGLQDLLPGTHLPVTAAEDPVLGPEPAGGGGGAWKGFCDDGLGPLEEETQVERSLDLARHPGVLQLFHPAQQVEGDLALAPADSQGQTEPGAVGGLMENPGDLLPGPDRVALALQENETGCNSHAFGDRTLGNALDGEAVQGEPEVLRGPDLTPQPGLRPARAGGTEQEKKDGKGEQDRSHGGLQRREGATMVHRPEAVGKLLRAE